MTDQPTSGTEDPGRRALVVRGGWDGHAPVEATDRFIPVKASMRAGCGDRGWWFDTAALTADETVRRILLEADDRARVGPSPAAP